MNHITQEHQLVARLQSLLARMSNDERTALMFEADGDTLRDAMEYIRKAAKSRAALAQPDCRTCTNLYRNTVGEKKCAITDCTNGDKYEAARKVVLWRTEP